MGMRIRAITRNATVVIIVLLVVAATGGVSYYYLLQKPNPTLVRLATVPYDPPFFPLIVEKGFGLAHGINVTLTVFPSTNGILNALKAGQIDAAYVGMNPGFLNAVNEGLDLKFLAAGAEISGGQPRGPNLPKYYIDGCAIDNNLYNKGATTLSQLTKDKGVIWGASARGGIIEFFIDTWFEREGYNESNFNVQYMGSPSADLAAFSGGKLHVFCETATYLLEVQSRGFGHILMWDTQVYPPNIIQPSYVIALGSFVTSHPDAAKSLVSAYTDAYNWVGNYGMKPENINYTASLAEKYYNAPPSTYLVSIKGVGAISPYIIPASINTFENSYVSWGVLKARVSPTNLIAPSVSLVNQTSS